MIFYEADGLTLSGIRSDGSKFSRYYMEGSAYNDMLMVRDAQLQAIRENNQSITNYQTALANTQVSVDAGHAVPAPTKPLMKLVSDTGETTFVPFDPPLKDLIPAAAGRPAPSGSIKVETQDKQAILFNMVQAMFRRMFPEG